MKIDEFYFISQRKCSLDSPFISLHIFFQFPSLHNDLIFRWRYFMLIILFHFHLWYEQSSIMIKSFHIAHFSSEIIQLQREIKKLKSSFITSTQSSEIALSSINLPQLQFSLPPRPLPIRTSIQFQLNSLANCNRSATLEGIMDQIRLNW